MQSILQYKRFGWQARDQCERDKKRADALEHGNPANSAVRCAPKEEDQRGNRPWFVADTKSSDTEAASDQSPDPRDPEKAE